MAVVEVVVPAHLRGLICEELLGAYGACAETIYATLQGPYDQEALAKLLDARRRLAELDALIDQLGWTLQAPAEPATLKGPRHQVYDTVAYAFYVVLDRLSEGEAIPARYCQDIPGMRQGLADAHTLLGLVEQTAPQRRPRRRRARRRNRIQANV